MTAPAKLLTLDFLRSHRTYRNAAGEKVPGVTSVLGLINKPQLLKWAWEIGRSGQDLEAARQKPADIGSVAHGLVEAHLRGMQLDTTNIAPDMLDKAETSFIRFTQWWDNEDLVVVHTELPLVSETLQVGGTLDILAARKDPAALVCIDLKSGKALYEEMAYQAAVYAAMYEEVHRQTVDEVLLVRISKDEQDDLEVRQVNNRTQRVRAFAALAEARRQLLASGMRF